ncbi:polysulfide reductase NrfD [bacterium]|nr:polysulfide reductase NrfD [bacterium]
MTEIVSGNVNPHISPHMEIWEWQIPAYLFLGGLVAGLMVLNGIWRLQGKQLEGQSVLRLGAIFAPVLLSLGMLFLFLDLTYKVHVFRFYTAFKPASPMSWGAWILLLVYPVQILALALPGGIDRFGWKLEFLNPLWERIKGITAKFEKQIAWISIASGSGLGIYTGILLSVNAARPIWNSSILGPLFLVSGLSAGAAFALLLNPSNKEERKLVRLDTAFLAGELILLILFVIGHLSGVQANRESLELIMGGGFTAPFWGFVVGLGILLPLWLEVRELTHKPTPFWIAPVFVLAGGLALRFVFVFAGQAG